MCAKCPFRGTATSNNNWDASVTMSTRPSFTKHLTIPRILINMGLMSQNEAKYQWSLQAPFRKVLSQWFTLCHLTVINWIANFHPPKCQQQGYCFMPILTIFQSINPQLHRHRQGWAVTVSSHNSHFKPGSFRIITFVFGTRV